MQPNVFLVETCGNMDKEYCYMSECIHEIYRMCNLSKNMIDCIGCDYHAFILNKLENMALYFDGFQPFNLPQKYIDERKPR